MAVASSQASGAELEAGPAAASARSMNRRLTA